MLRFNRIRTTGDFRSAHDELDRPGRPALSEPWGPGKVVLTADAAPAKQGAKLLNRKLGTTVFGAGAAVGTATVTIPTPS